MRRARERGFTLLELIVAAGIMALIAVFSWRGLDALIREREAIAASQAAIDVIQRTFARVERDALLAYDAQLEENGTMRLVAGTSSIDGTPAATVEYRLLSGALTRSVVGTDAAPTVLLDGVTTLSLEAYVPAAGGGAWVRSKSAASEPVRPRPDGANAPGNPNTPAVVPGAPPLRGSAAPNIPGVARGSVQPAATGPIVAAATGIRLIFVRSDGSRVTRSFMVGGA